MLTGFDLEGFKCYGERVGVEVRPITLILGGNSSGKSTLLQGLLALAQSVDDRRQLPRYLAIAGTFVDLGRFDQTVYAGAGEDQRVIRLGAPSAGGVRFEFVLGPDGRRGELRRVSFPLDRGADWWFQVRWNALDQGAELLPDPAGLDHFRNLSRNAKEMVSHLRRGPSSAGDAEQSPQLSIAVSVASDNVVRSAIHADAEVSADLQELMDGQNLNSEGLSPTLTFRLTEHVRGALGTVHTALQTVFPIGPVRVHGVRARAVDDARDDRWVGFHGERLLQVIADAGPERVLHQVNRWASILQVPYKFIWEQAGGTTASVVELLVESLIGPAHRVGVPDVGFGIGQILPLLVQMAVMEEGVLTIEQPEIHLHPRMQARLASVFADWVGSAEVAGSRRVIAETHSEHLVLALLGLVRERGSLAPDAVSIVAVAPPPEDAKSPELRSIMVDEDGEMIGPWPGGFFPERAKLLRYGRLDP